MSVAVDERPSVSELLPVDKPSLWPERGLDVLYTLSWRDYQPIQLETMKRRFDLLRGKIDSLDRLASRQKVDGFDSFSEALPLFFDHRVMKSYPLAIIENRDFPKLTAWLNRLTAHDLTKMDLSGLKTIDDWLTRLDDFGMLVGHSTGTTGKLSFMPRSQSEYPAWHSAYHEAFRASSGVDGRKEFVDTFYPGYRGGHQMGLKLLWLFNMPAAGGPEHYHTLYQSRMSADLMALAGRLQAAEDRGEVDKLGLDPALLEKRREMIEQGKRREQDMQAWFEKLSVDFRGQRVKIGGTFGDLIRVAQHGKAKGLTCEFGAGSWIASGGGMKGFKEIPDNWRGLIMDFFGIDRITSTYGMSEMTGLTPKCPHEHYHFPPYMVPILIDKDANELPREGVQTGRLACFDLLAESYWGGFISGDQVTMHWDDACPCGWKGPYVEDNISRFAEMEGGDDKITCAGSAQAYNEFMDYVMQV
jgi:hypothetical protein